MSRCPRHYALIACLAPVLGADGDGDRLTLNVQPVIFLGTEKWGAAQLMPQRKSVETVRVSEGGR